MNKLEKFDDPLRSSTVLYTHVRSSDSETFYSTLQSSTPRIGKHRKVPEDYHEHYIYNSFFSKASESTGISFCSLYLRGF